MAFRRSIVVIALVAVFVDGRHSMHVEDDGSVISRLSASCVAEGTVTNNTSSLATQ